MQELTGPEFVNDLLTKRYKTRQKYNYLVEQYNRAIKTKGMTNARLEKIRLEYDEKLKILSENVSAYDDMIRHYQHKKNLDKLKLKPFEDPNLAEKTYVNNFFSDQKLEDSFQHVENIKKSADRLKSIMKMNELSDFEKFELALHGGSDYTNSLCNLFLNTKYGENTLNLKDACIGFQRVNEEIFQPVIDKDSRIMKLLDKSIISLEKPY